jgi:hypothetical protein
VLSQLRLRYQPVVFIGRKLGDGVQPVVLHRKEATPAARVYTRFENCRRRSGGTSTSAERKIASLTSFQLKWRPSTASRRTCGRRAKRHVSRFSCQSENRMAVASPIHAVTPAGPPGRGKQASP